MSNPIFKINFPGTMVCCNWSGISKKVYRVNFYWCLRKNFCEMYPDGIMTKVLMILSEYFVENWEEFIQEKTAMDIYLDRITVEKFGHPTTMQLPVKLVESVNNATKVDIFLNVMMYVACSKWGRDYIRSQISESL